MTKRELESAVVIFAGEEGASVITINAPAGKIEKCLALLKDLGEGDSSLAGARRVATKFLKALLAQEQSYKEMKTWEIYFHPDWLYPAWVQKSREPRYLGAYIVDPADGEVVMNWQPGQGWINVNEDE